MNDTPRTDYDEGWWSRQYENSREAGWPPIGFVVDADFARTLERELNAFVHLVLGDEATLTLSGNVVLAVAKLKSDLEELARLRTGGCARDQRTTQFCAEAVELEAKLEAWKAYAGRLEEAGDRLTDLARPSDFDRWEKAKETKP